jgi:hypothetical protein
MSELLASRIYDLKIAGYDDSLKKVQQLTNAFNAMDKAKRKLNEILKTKTEAGDTVAADALVKRLADLEKQLAAVTKQKAAAKRESDLLLSSEQAYAKSELDAIKSVKDATKYTTELAKEKEKAAKAAEKAAAANRIEANSYNDVRNQLAQLRPFIQNKNANSSSTISIGSGNLNFDQAIAKFKELSAAEQAFRRQFQADGTLVSEYSSGIINAFNKLGLSNLISKNKNDIQGQLRILRTESQELANQLSRTGTIGSEGFGRLEVKLKENIALQEQLEGQLKTINTTLSQTGSIGQKITGAIGSGFKDIKSHVNNLLVTYVGFQAAINAGQKFVTQNYELSDSISQLQIYLKGSKEAADELVDSLKKIPTRTSLAQLVDISTVVAKKGVVKQEIAGVTQALDQLFVVLGKEIGDPHEAVSSLVKLVNVYSEDKHVTAKNIGDIGAAVQKLTSSGVATGSFLINFAERLAGVRGITGVSIQNVLGLGAALQELGQRSEVAGTAASQLVIKLFADIPKYASFAGKSVAEFTKTVTENPVEALIQLAQGLKNNKAGLDEVAQAFDAAGIHGARVLGVLGDIAGNADYMRKRLVDANKAFGDQASIVAAAAIKQNNFAATLDNVRKKFELLGTNKTLQGFILGVGSAIAFLLGHLEIAIPLVVTIIGLTNTWVGTLIRLTAAYTVQISAWIIERAQLIATNAVRVTSNFLIAVYTAATIRSATASGLAAVAYRLLAASIALITSPLGIAVGLIVAFTTAIGIFAASAKDVNAAVGSLAEKQKLHNEQLKVAAELQSIVNKETASERDHINALVAVLKNANASYDEKARALKKLIDINPDYLSGLTQDNISTEEGIGIINRYIAKIEQLSDAKARVNLKAKLKEQLLESQTNTDALLIEQQQKPELSASKKFFYGKDGKLFGFGDRNRYDVDQDIKKEREIVDGVSLKLKALDASNNKQITDLQKSIKDKQTRLTGLKKDSDQAKKLAQDIATDQETLFTIEGIEAPKTVPTATETTPQETQGVKELQARLKAVKQEIAEIGKIKDQNVTQKKKLEDLRKERAEIIKLIKEQGGSTTTTHLKGSRLSYDDKEQFKDIEAKRDEDLASQNLQRAQNTITEEAYLKNILKINQDAIDAKLKLLNGSNAQERKITSELKLDRITQERETNNKIFEERKKVLKATLDEQIKDLQESNRLVQDDVSISNTDKAKKKQQTDESIYNLTLKYGTDIEVLEKQFGQQSIQNAKEVADAIREIRENLRKDEQEDLKAQLKDATDAGEKDIANFKKTIEAQRLAIVTSNKPQKKKEVALDQLKKEEDFGVLVREVARNTIEKEIYEKLLKAKIITQQEYDNFLAESYKKEQELHDAGVKNTEKSIEDVKTLGQVITNKVSRIFGFDDGTDTGKAKEKLLAETISQSYQLAENAMNSFFDAERANVDRNKQIIEKRIDQEKEQRLAQATSQAEREAIEREAQVKKDKADREAFEKNKKIQLAQAKINLGIQLANLAVIAFAPNPANIATLGTAGAIMYAIQAAIAFANFGANVKRISSAQYAGGGKIKPEDVKNGRITVESNIPTQPNGDNILATVKKGEVILNEEQQARIGGPAVFKSVGVPGFAGGGYIDDKKMYSYSRGGFTGLDYSGALGSNLQAPFNPSAFLNPKNGGSSADMQELKLMVGVLTENIGEVSRNVHERIDNLRVVNDPVEAAKVNDKIKKLKSIGKLR